MARQIQVARSHGFSVEITVTGAARAGEKYKPVKLENGDVLLKRIQGDMIRK